MSIFYHNDYNEMVRIKSIKLIRFGNSNTNFILIMLSYSANNLAIFIGIYKQNFYETNQFLFRITKTMNKL